MTDKKPGYLFIDNPAFLFGISIQSKIGYTDCFRFQRSNGWLNKMQLSDYCQVHNWGRITNNKKSLIHWQTLSLHLSLRGYNASIFFLFLIVRQTPILKAPPKPLPFQKTENPRYRDESPALLLIVPLPQFSQPHCLLIS